MKTEYARPTIVATAKAGVPAESLLNHLLNENDRDDELFLTLVDIVVLFLN